MGGLHDSNLDSMAWSPATCQIEFFFDDLYSNFEGYPGYPGKEKGSLKFLGVKNLRFDLTADGCLRVFEVLPVEGKRGAVSLNFWPGGRIEVEFEHAVFPECRLR